MDQLYLKWLSSHNKFGVLKDDIHSLDKKKLDLAQARRLILRQRDFLTPLERNFFRVRFLEIGELQRNIKREKIQHTKKHNQLCVDIGPNIISKWRKKIKIKQNNSLPFSDKPYIT